MTVREKILHIETLMMKLGYDEIIERLERGEGSGALTGFSDAKRAEEPGSAEGLPQSLAVSPVEARAAIVFARGALFRKAANHDDRGNDLFETGRDELGEIEEQMAALCRKHAETLWSLLPEPESEQSENAGDGKQSQESPEADATPSNGTASGRRNGAAQPPEGQRQ